VGAGMRVGECLIKEWNQQIKEYVIIV